MTIRNQQLSLIDIIRAEEFTETDFLECFIETDSDRAILKKLKGPGAHLIEGPRGVGKSSLLKKAEFELDEQFRQDKSILGVYVNFKASLRVHSKHAGFGFDPFICWVTAKILESFYKKLKKTGLISSTIINDKYTRLLSIEESWDANSLERIIQDLQNLAIFSNQDEIESIQNRLSKTPLSSFANAESIANFISTTAEELSIEKIIFLFDEAAHTFNEQQQETFFSFFKLLHGDTISVKAATYPGITSYGGNFEIGQDAIRLNISSIEENSEAGRSELRKHFREMLRKRVHQNQFKKTIRNGEALDLLIYLSNGNPRAFLQTVSKWLLKSKLGIRNALTVTNNYVSRELTTYHLGLKDRLPRSSSHIELGMALIKEHIVPELQKKNQIKGPKPSEQSIYFTIDPLVPQKVKRAIYLLEYSGFIYAKGLVKTKGRKPATRYAMNLGVAVAEKIFNSTFSATPHDAIRKIDIADYREFHSSDYRLEDLANEYQEEEECPNGHRRQTEGDFCAVCGAKFEANLVIEKLLDDSLEKLSLTSFLKKKLQDDCEAATVRDVLKFTESELRKVRLIGPARARTIANAAEEYISG